jgi:hypothetical protein
MSVERQRLIRHYAWKMSEETVCGDTFGNRVKLCNLLELFAVDIDAQHKPKEEICPANTAGSKPDCTTGQTADCGTTPNLIPGDGEFTGRGRI